MFALGRWDEGEPAFTFKAGEVAFERLRDRSGLRPAPYLASRGLKWIQHHAAPGLADDELRDYLRHSHTLVVAGLTRKMRRALGLDPLQAEAALAAGQTFLNTV